MPAFFSSWNVIFIGVGVVAAIALVIYGFFALACARGVRSCEYQACPSGLLCVDHGAGKKWCESPRCSDVNALPGYVKQSAAEVMDAIGQKAADVREWMNKK